MQLRVPAAASSIAVLAPCTRVRLIASRTLNVKLTMIRSVDEFEAEALSLPQHLRAHLAEALLSSLDEDADIERAWIEEAERRSKELRDGTVTGVPADEVFSRAYRRFT